MDDRRRDGVTNSSLRTKEQGTHLTLNEHDDDDDEIIYVKIRLFLIIDTADLHRVCDSMLQRAQKCIDVQEDHFQHHL